MYKNFLRVASANIKTKLLNVVENKNEILKYIEYAKKNDVDLVLFPELTLTGVSAGELISTPEIFSKCEIALKEILENTKDFNGVIIVGSPIKSQNKYHNALVCMQEGHILNIVVKTNLQYEEMKFFSQFIKDSYFDFNDDSYSLYDSRSIALEFKNIHIQLLFENDLTSKSVSFNNAANLVFISGGSMTNANSLMSLENNLISISKLNRLGLVYAGASNYESSTNGVYSAEKYIIENGHLLEKGKSFTNGLIISDINIDEIQTNQTNNYMSVNEDNYNLYYGLEFKLNEKEIKLRRNIEKHPYFPKDNFDAFLKNILEIQSEALVRRLRQLPDNKIFIGISGGLDSTLGVIVASLAYYKLGLDSKNIFTITMPGLGTSDRTKNNATNLAKAYNTTFKEISIVDSVKQHFKDIEHDENDFTVTYENSQARERTQVLMDLSNKHGGIVLGTGNMSEIALGWATFNGDHMSMYNVNSGLPKTLLREVVRYVANNTKNELLRDTLMDIIATPISPELLPTNEDGNIAQKTEENVGPYELHDFFLYHLLNNKSKINDIKFMANEAFSDKYDEEIIDKYLNKFLWRLQTQQFKRNTSVDGPQILEYSLNSKIGFIMPSDIDPNSLKIN